MTEMQAAIGRGQLRKLPDWVDDPAAQRRRPDGAVFGHGGVAGDAPAAGNVACLLQVLRLRPAGTAEAGMGPGPDHERGRAPGDPLLQRELQ